MNFNLTKIHNFALLSIQVTKVISGDFVDLVKPQELIAA